MSSGEEFLKVTSAIIGCFSVLWSTIHGPDDVRYVRRVDDRVLFLALLASPCFAIPNLEHWFCENILIFSILSGFEMEALFAHLDRFEIFLQGSSVLYRKFVHPWLSKNEKVKIIFC